MIENPVYYFNVKEKASSFHFADRLSRLMKENCKSTQQPVVLCIGTDRVTGDSLGPLIGYKLSKSSIPKFSVYGTLKNPVHALNLDETIKEIYSTFKDPFLIAIDASLGTIKHIGFITMGKGPLTPGSGVKKELLPVGDIFITGIVNISGILDNLLLQTTRLDTVMELADCIALGIKIAGQNYHLTCILPNRKLNRPGISLSQ